MNTGDLQQGWLHLGPARAGPILAEVLRGEQVVVPLELPHAMRHQLLGQEAALGEVQHGRRSHYRVIILPNVVF